MFFKGAGKIIGEIMRSKKHILMILLVSFFFYILSALLSNLTNITSFTKNYGFISSAKFTFALIAGFHNTIFFTSLISIIILGVLTGVLVSLMAYKYELTKNADKGGVVGGIGVFLGVFAPGCGACGIGLAALLGLSSSLAALPFRGNEISLIAIFILGYSIYSISDKFYKCQIDNFPKRNMKGGEKK